MKNMQWLIYLQDLIRSEKAKLFCWQLTLKWEGSLWKIQKVFLQSKHLEQQNQFIRVWCLQRILHCYPCSGVLLFNWLKMASIHELIWNGRAPKSLKREQLRQWSSLQGKPFWYLPFFFSFLAPHWYY